MKRHLIAAGATIIALTAWVGTATAADEPPARGEQLLGQLAGTLQGAPAAGTAGQSASNASLPVGMSSVVAVAPGSSSADQNASNTADADASNKGTTDQTATATQTGGTVGRPARTQSRAPRPLASLARHRIRSTSQ